MFKFLILIIFSFNVNAFFDVGTSLSNSMQGRVIPSLHIGKIMGSGYASIHSTGVQTELYYHNVYTAAYYLQKDWGDLFFTKLIAGPGIGVMYAKMSYKEDKDAKDETADDLMYGPGLRVEFPFGSNFYMSLESIMGIGGAAVIALSFRDLSMLTMGWRFN